jgi:hypothetical protein
MINNTGLASEAIQRKLDIISIPELVILLTNKVCFPTRIHQFHTRHLPNT